MDTECRRTTKSKICFHFGTIEMEFILLQPKFLSQTLKLHIKRNVHHTKATNLSNNLRNMNEMRASSLCETKSCVHFFRKQVMITNRKSMYTHITFQKIVPMDSANLHNPHERGRG